MDNNNRYRLIIDASNINSGGGKVLLLNLIKALPKSDRFFIAVGDKLDCKDIFGRNLIIKIIPNNIFCRILNQYQIYKMSNISENILYFGNFPPLFKSYKNKIVFFQNRLIIDRPSLAKYSIFEKIKINFQKLRLYIARKNADYYIVQTNSMQNLLRRFIKSDVEIKVIPFFDAENISLNKNKKYDFIYVASGEPHKNHRNLIKAWELLANEGFYPTLLLTINESDYNSLLNVINKSIKNNNLKIFNVGSISTDLLYKYYCESQSLIYPSLVESFGLPLLEAQSLGLPILASELDYVRDLVCPSESFNPESHISIARAVSRFMGYASPPPRISSAINFLDVVLLKPN
jgi:glycosyltransferase involved in cell wall biosynthesis